MPSAKTSTASSGTKRKREQGPKFYAVKKGYRPGVYLSWADCQAQTTGFKGAQFKAFETQQEAESWAAGQPLATSKSNKPPRFYGVASGHAPGVYTDWPTAQAQISGSLKPKYKKFDTREEAEEFVRTNGASAAKPATPAPAMVENPYTDSDGVTTTASKTKRRKKGEEDTPSAAPNKDGFAELLKGAADYIGINRDEQPGTGPLPPGAEDGFDPRVLLNPTTGKIEWKTDEQLKAKKLVANPDSMKMLKIYTDGSSLGNGKIGAFAGVGVYFGPNDDRNVSEPLAGARQTNQRAELTAILRALDIAPRHRDVTIYTDSNYSINCVTVWCHSWIKNNWINSSKKPVENKDLIEAILDRMKEREKLKVVTKLEWVKGHASDPGNVAADELAVAGAREAKANGVPGA